MGRKPKEVRYQTRHYVEEYHKINECIRCIYWWTRWRMTEGQGKSHLAKHCVRTDDFGGLRFNPMPRGTTVIKYHQMEDFNQCVMACNDMTQELIQIYGTLPQTHEGVEEWTKLRGSRGVSERRWESILIDLFDLYVARLRGHK